MENESQAELNQSLQELLSSGRYPDCTVVCGSDTYQLHKAIICPRSSYFNAVFTHDMKEKASGIVNLEDDDPEAVKSMVHYLYHLDYSRLPASEPVPAEAEVRLADTAPLAKPADARAVDEAPAEPFNRVWLEPKPKRCKICGEPRRRCIGMPNLIHHSRVYALADKRGILSLKSVAAKKFRIECERWWDYNEFVDAAREAYSTTLDDDRGLRDAIVDTIQAHRHLLDIGNVKSVLRESQLAFDLLMASRSGAYVVEE